MAFAPARDDAPPLRPPPSDPTRATSVAIWAVIALPFVLRAAQVLRAGRGWLVTVVPDDAFYYLEVARRIAEGQGSTFDGVHRTNGYHPLWQGLGAVVAAVVPGGTPQIRAMLLGGLLLAGLALVLAVGVISRAVGRRAGLFAGVVAAWSAYPVVLANGMEGSVVAGAFALVLVTLERALREERHRDALLAGVASAVLVLARLDELLVVGLVPLATWWWSAERRRQVLWWAAGFLSVGAPAALWYVATWGPRLTTSASVKRIWMADHIEEEFGSRLSVDYAGDLVAAVGRYVAHGLHLLPPRGASGPVVFAVLGVASATVVARRLSRRSRPAREAAGPHDPTVQSARRALAVVGAAVILKALFDIVLAPLWAEAWYAAPQRPALPLVVGVAAWMGIERWDRRWRGAALAVVVVLAGCGAVELLHRAGADIDPARGSRWQHQIDAAVDFVVAEGPPGRYGARDAGLLGFRLHGRREVVNLDGLVNDYDFVEVVRTHPSWIERIEAGEVDVLVQRLGPTARSELGCATEMWRSEPVGAAPVYVLDVRTCRG